MATPVLNYVRVFLALVFSIFLLQATATPIHGENGTVPERSSKILGEQYPNLLGKRARFDVNRRSCSSEQVALLDVAKGDAIAAVSY